MSTIDLSTFQIEKGSKFTEYEPPAPSPDYPIEIHSLNDFDVVSSVGKENLLKDSNREWKSHNEYIAPSYNLNKIFDKHPIGQTYTISFDAKSDDISKNSSLRFYPNPGSTVQNKYIFSSRRFTGLTTKYQRFSHTITPYLSSDPSFPRTGMSFYGQYDTGNIPTIRNIKIELGTTATPYHPAPEDITENDNHPLIDKINLTFSEPLRSVGDVHDKLFRDNSDGLWKVERNVREIYIKDASDITTTTPTGGANSYHFGGSVAFSVRLYSKLRFSPLKPMISSHLRFTENNNFNAKGISDNEVNTVHVFGETGSTAAYIRVPEDLINVKEGDSTEVLVDSFKNWVNSSNVKLMYARFESEVEVETLPQETQDKLNNLRSFQDSNYVYTVVNN